MIKLPSFFVALFLYATSLAAEEPTKNYNKYWPQWRGPLATGVAPHGNPPIEWSEDKNIRWKIDLPGEGLSAPVIWENQIFILAAIDTKKGGDAEKASKIDANFPNWMKRNKVAVASENVQAFAIVSIDRKTGDTIWQQTPREEHPHEGTHLDASWASNSPVTDGEQVFAYFGSRGLYCYDLKGNLKWEKDLGDMRTRNGFGEGSSPALHGDFLVINWDHEDDSFIVALDKNTGKQLWRKERDEVTSWSTPIIVEVNGKPQVIINATTRTRGYDLKTGDVVWEVGGMTINTIPSPVYNEGIVYVASGYRGSLLQAIKLAEAKGDLTKSSALLWSHDRDTPYVPSLLLFDDFLYFMKSNKGVLTVLNPNTGTHYLGPTRLEGIKNIYASPVAAQNRIYISGRDGTTTVLEKGPELKVLAQNKLDDKIDASAAIVGGDLYLRGHEFLYAIGK